VAPLRPALVNAGSKTSNWLAIERPWICALCVRLANATIPNGSLRLLELVREKGPAIETRACPTAGLGGRIGSGEPDPERRLERHWNSVPVSDAEAGLIGELSRPVIRPSWIRVAEQAGSLSPSSVTCPM
jgi:hypothetical protein